MAKQVSRDGGEQLQSAIPIRLISRGLSEPYHDRLRFFIIAISCLYCTRCREAMGDYSLTKELPTNIVSNFHFFTLFGFVAAIRPLWGRLR